MMPTHGELLDFAKWAQTIQPRALAYIQKEGFVFDNLDDPWQKLAFSLYTDLCEIESRARHLLEEE